MSSRATRGTYYIFVGAVLGACSHAVRTPAPAAPYEVLAVRYATLPQFRVSGLIAGADTSRRLDIAMMVWLINGNGRHVLVDAGFHRRDLVDRWKPADFVEPSVAVARAGVKPEDVTDIILS